MCTTRALRPASAPHMHAGAGRGGQFAHGHGPAHLLQPAHPLPPSAARPAWCKRRLGSATAHRPGLPGPALPAPGCGLLGGAPTEAADLATATTRLTRSECEHMIRVAEPRFSRSPVRGSVTRVRTSSTAMLGGTNDAVVRRVRERIARFSGYDVSPPRHCMGAVWALHGALHGHCMGAAPALHAGEPARAAHPAYATVHMRCR